MDSAALRDWLIARGVPPSELENIPEPPVLGDIGRTILLALQNDNAVAAAIMSLIGRVAALEARVTALEGGGGDA